MRKQTKLVAVLSAAALLAIGASMTSFAAGWTQEDGTWVYLDRDGERVTESWKKSGANYYWLDEDGLMATDMLVEDGDNYYYVDANGVRVTNQWASIENEDGDTVNDNEVDTLWYYLGTSGKAVKDKSSTINGKKYFFDDEGRMLSGWLTDVDDNDSSKYEIYYLGEENEGWAYTGWQFLEPDEGVSPEGARANYNDEVWFYFQSSGKAHKNARKYINGKYYAFDGNGVMITDWQTATVNGVATADVIPDNLKNIGLKNAGNSSFYDIDNGDQGSGWIYTYAERDESGDQKWYYLLPSADNHVFNANSTSGVSAYKYTAGVRDTKTTDNIAARIIKGKTYLFDGTGALLTGVYQFNSDVSRNGGLPLSGTAGSNIYYFDKNSGSVEGQMVTGKTTVTYDGENFTYYFKEDGSAYTNIIKSDAAYDSRGIRLEAKDGNSYAIYKISSIGTLKIGNDTYDAGTIVVSSSGKAKKSGTITIDGVKYELKNYLVVKAYDKDDKTAKDDTNLYDPAHIRPASSTN